MRDIDFSRKFSLDRLRLSRMVSCIFRKPSASDLEVGSEMGVNPYMVTGFRGWLRKTGLGGGISGTYELSPFGKLVATYDPELNHSGTLWLLHYHLVSEHAERAEVWYRAFNEFLTPGVRFDRTALQVYVERTLEATPKNKTGIAKDCNEFIKGYKAPIGLGKLELVREGENDMCEVGLVRLPEPTIFAYVLFDAWQRRFDHTDTLRVTQVCQEPELPGKVFAARRDQVVQSLQTLQSMGLVNIVDSQHEPVTRRFRDDPHQLIATFYASL